jgi:hypothetical protein
MFAGAEDARPRQERGEFFSEGDHLVRIDAVKAAKSRKGDEYVAVEATCLLSDNAAIRPGAPLSHLYMCRYDSFLGDMKAFAAVGENCDPAEVDEAGLEAICGEDNPFQGKILRVRAKIVKTKKGGDFTILNWRQPSPEEIAQYSRKPTA